jgi:hypothetical protein
VNATIVNFTCVSVDESHRITANDINEHWRILSPVLVALFVAFENNFIGLFDCVSSFVVVVNHSTVDRSFAHFRLSSSSHVHVEHRIYISYSFLGSCRSSSSLSMRQLSTSTSDRHHHRIHLVVLLDSHRIHSSVGHFARTLNISFCSFPRDPIDISDDLS